MNTRPALPLACAVVLTGLTACAGTDATSPRLLPTAQVLADPVLPAHARSVDRSPGAVSADAESRADSLRGRAEALRRPVIEPELRDRMTGG